MDEVNRNRLEEFRQLRKEIRQSEEHLIADKQSPQTPRDINPLRKLLRNLKKESCHGVIIESDSSRSMLSSAPSVEGILRKKLASPDTII